MSGFGAESIAEIVTEFDTAEEALTDLMVRLRLVYERGDRVELRGVEYLDVHDFELSLRASLSLRGWIRSPLRN